LWISRPSRPLLGGVLAGSRMPSRYFDHWYRLEAAEDNAVMGWRGWAAQVLAAAVLLVVAGIALLAVGVTAAGAELAGNLRPATLRCIEGSGTLGPGQRNLALSRRSRRRLHPPRAPARPRPGHTPYAGRLVTAQLTRRPRTRSGRRTKPWSADCRKPCECRGWAPPAGDARVARSSTLSSARRAPV
jgi:hypothetical protein